MQIPLINEHLFYKYFARLSVGNATKGSATYGCWHPCFSLTWKFDGDSESDILNFVFMNVVIHVQLYLYVFFINS